MKLPEDDATQAACTFFYSFSRFEFALKENGFLKGKDRVVPDWKRFITKNEGQYQQKREAMLLIASPPKQQTAHNHGISWSPLQFEADCPPLKQVVTIVKTMRNNLFHGGKHGVGGWDDPERMMELLQAGTATLDHLAILGGFEVDYSGDGY